MVIMRDIGKMIKLMEKVYFNILMVIYMMVNGKMACQMDMVLIPIKMEHTIKVCLKMNRKMEKVYKDGLMDLGMKVNLKMAKSMDSDVIKWMKIVHTLGNGTKI